jgi:hypothetical protein|tara:strand:- start:911 stop:1108 length:198 start_codon:yes stop_codon:yes gene_type:complete
VRGLLVVSVRLMSLNQPSQKRLVYFIPEPREGFAVPQSNDVEIEDRGLMYLFNRDRGFDILEFTG